MFRFENATIRAGGKILFSDLNWQVGHGEKVALVGPNGSGKTTLLRVIAGHHELDAGRLHLARTTALGYLPQTGVAHAGRSVFQEARSVFDEVQNLKRIQARLLRELEVLPQDSAAIHEVLEEVQRIEDRLHHLGGYRIDAEVGTVLAGLGFQKSSWDQPTETLSGGWQMRLALAKLLLRSPNLILLDEPTNHLDIHARAWLADYLKSSRATILVVAHDRHFLDRVADKTTEIEASSLIDYTGGYSAYLKQKEKRQAEQRQAFKQQQKEIERIRAFVERFRYKATKASQVQSRLNRLAKLERLAPPPPPRRRLRVRFPDPPRSASIVAELRGASKSYGDTIVLRNVDLTVHAGDKIALIGPNGCGKTTLMKLLSAKESPDRGLRRLGDNVITAYFAQDQATILSGDNTVLEELQSSAPGLGEPQARNLLGAFLFSGEDVKKPVSVLSGGERSRLALCKLLTVSANFLLLDEPTNHLDLASKEVLLQALVDFPGTVVFVSHDRYFIDHLANRVMEIQDGSLVTYPGTLSEYLHHKRLADQDPETVPPAAGTGVGTTPTTPSPASTGAAAFRERKRAARELARLTRHSESLQEAILEKEARLEEVTGSMNDPKMGTRYQELLQLEEERQALVTEIEHLYTEWQEVTEKLESIP